MENNKERQTGTFYAVAFPSGGRYFIIFPDFNHLLPQASALDQCPAKAREFLHSVLLRRLIDGEALPTAADRDTCSQNTLDYIRRVRFPLDGDAPIFPVPYNREALDRIAELVKAFREADPGEDTPVSPGQWEYITTTASEA